MAMRKPKMKFSRIKTRVPEKHVISKKFDRMAWRLNKWSDYMDWLSFLETVIAVNEDVGAGAQNIDSFDVRVSPITSRKNPPGKIFNDFDIFQGPMLIEQEVQQIEQMTNRTRIELMWSCRLR